MSKRLQILMDEEELTELKKLAREENVSVAEWVRRAIAAAKSGQPKGSQSRKLEAVRLAIQYSFPTADIDQMLNEIEAGYHPE